MQKLLLLGGPSFIGRHLLLELEQLNQYEVTLFNRGQTNPDLFPQFKRIIGDRNTDDVEQLAEENWDYIIDLSCYYPASLERILKVINKEHLKRYIFISTCSIYDNAHGKTDEPTPEDGLALTCSKEEAASPLPAAYGNKKVACEQILSHSKLDFISLRPGLVYGAYDYTDRLYYWLYQVQTQDKILVPDHGERLFSITYVKDLVAACLEAIEIAQHRIFYNVMSQEKISIAQIIQTASKILKRAPQVISATPAFLHQQKIAAWTGMPLWIDGDYFTFSNKKLLLDFQLSITEWEWSIEQSIAYAASLNWPVPKYGISEAKRLELLHLLENQA